MDNSDRWNYEKYLEANQKQIQTGMEMFNWVLNNTGVKKGNFADIGCGTGEIAKYALEKNFDVLGIDKSNSMLKQASKLIGNNIENQDAENLVLKNNIYDFIYSGYLIHWLNNIDSFTNTVARALKPKGVISFIWHFAFPSTQLDLTYETFQNVSTQKKYDKFFKKYPLGLMRNPVDKIDDILANYGIEIIHTKLSRINRIYKQTEIINTKEFRIILRERFKKTGLTLHTSIFGDEINEFIDEVFDSLLEKKLFDLNTIGIVAEKK